MIKGGALHGLEGGSRFTIIFLKKLSKIGSFCDILSDFALFLVFRIYKSPQSGVVVHQKKL